MATHSMKEGIAVLLERSGRINLKKAVNHEGHEGILRKSIDWAKNHFNLFGDSLLSVK